MAIRRVHRDEEGPYFKGEGYKFRLHHYNLPSHLEVTSVSCGHGSALAHYILRGKTYSVSSATGCKRAPVVKNRPSTR